MQEELETDELPSTSVFLLVDLTDKATRLGLGTMMRWAPERRQEIGELLELGDGPPI